MMFFVRMMLNFPGKEYFISSDTNNEVFYEWIFVFSFSRPVLLMNFSILLLFELYTLILRLCPPVQFVVFILFLSFSFTHFFSIFLFFIWKVLSEQSFFSCPPLVRPHMNTNWIAFNCTQTLHSTTPIQKRPLFLHCR